MSQIFREPVFEKETRSAKRKVSIFLSQLAEDINNGEINQSYEKSFIPLTFSEVPRILSNHKFSRDEENMLLRIIRNHTIRSELAHASSSIFFISLISKLLLEIEKRPEDLVRITEDLSCFLHEISSRSVPATSNDIHKYWGNIFRDKWTDYLLHTSTHMAGAVGNIYIDNQKSSDTTVELTSGHSYRLKIPDEFRAMTNIRKFVATDCKIVLIDGLIEKESEIHILLHAFYEKAQPGIIFARGFKEEVLATLAVNWSRKTLKVLPICVPYDLEGINLLKDLAVIAGTDVISSLKGELISSIKFDDIVCVSKFKYHNDEIIIENNSTQVHVKNHIQNLKELVAESIEPERRELISRRIKGLLSRCVYIRLDDSLFEKKNINLDRLEAGVKVYKDAARFGMIDLSRIETDICFIRETVDCLMSYGFQKINFIALCEAIKRAISISRTLGNCATMILCKS